MRRALIRATLTPPDGAPTTQRQPPVFTMHQQTRGNSGGNRANGNVRNSRSAWGKRPSQPGGTRRATRRVRPGAMTAADSPRNGSQSRPAASRRGRGPLALSPPMADLDGKTGLVVGIANKRSLAWAIAQAADAAGARLTLSYANERFGEKTRDLAEIPEPAPRSSWAAT